MQVCTSLRTDNHSSIPPLSFFTGRMPFLPPNQQSQSTEGSRTPVERKRNLQWSGFQTVQKNESWCTGLYRVSLVERWPLRAATATSRVKRSRISEQPSPVWSARRLSGRGVVLKKWGTPETRLRQRFWNNLGLHKQGYILLIHVRKIATADLWSCPAIQLLVFECL